MCNIHRMYIVTAFQLHLLSFSALIPHIDMVLMRDATINTWSNPSLPHPIIWIVKLIILFYMKGVNEEKWVNLMHYADKHPKGVSYDKFIPHLHTVLLSPALQIHLIWSKNKRMWEMSGIIRWKSSAQLLFHTFKCVLRSAVLLPQAN